MSFMDRIPGGDEGVSVEHIRAGKIPGAPQFFAAKGELGEVVAVRTGGGGMGMAQFNRSPGRWRVWHSLYSSEKEGT